jgi:hypothetical protein
MMDLVHSHNYTKLYDNQKKHEWDQKLGMSVSDRVGKRVGILGYGSIGRQGMLVIFSYNHSTGFSPERLQRIQKMASLLDISTINSSQSPT